MAETDIEWTDATWNPVAGCSKVSAGCKNCYAMQMAYRLEAMGVEKYIGLAKKQGKKAEWTGQLRLDHNALEIPKKWRKPRHVFVNSMSDLFHPDVDIEFILKVWGVMKDTPRHAYQILTKRPERMLEILSNERFEVLPNVWLGTTVENSQTVGRIDCLKKVPATIRFISFEPLIDSVGSIDLKGIDWAIVGGESGQHARPIKEDWIDEIYAQCIEDNTAFFFKQWGTWGKDNKKRSKKANGRIYRGKTWDAKPTPPQHHENAL